MGYLPDKSGWARLDTTTIASGLFPLPTTKEWGEGQGEGQPIDVAGAETNPSPRSCLAGRGSDAKLALVVVSRRAQTVLKMCLNLASILL